MIIKEFQKEDFDDLDDEQEYRKYIEALRQKDPDDLTQDELSELVFSDMMESLEVGRQPFVQVDDCVTQNTQGEKVIQTPDGAQHKLDEPKRH